MSARERIAGNVANYVDERTGAAAWMKKNLNKVFPDHWSFMLGEIALYSFVILLLSGTFLTFWFDPSMREVVYEGAYEPLNGLSSTYSAFSSPAHSVSHANLTGSLELVFSHLESLKVSWAIHSLMTFSLVQVFELQRRFCKRYLWWVHTSLTSSSAEYSQVKPSSLASTQFTF